MPAPLAGPRAARRCPLFFIDFLPVIVYNLNQMANS